MGSLWWNCLYIRLNVPLPWFSVLHSKRHSCVYRCGVETRHEGRWSHVWWREFTAPADLELSGLFLTPRSLLMHGDALQGAPWTHIRNVFCGDTAVRVQIWLVTQTVVTSVCHQWYWHYCSLIWAPGVLKIRSPLDSVNTEWQLR
jgi:hypothetical protein